MLTMTDAAAEAVREVLAETELDVEVHDDHVHFRFNGLDELVD